MLYARDVSNVHGKRTVSDIKTSSLFNGPEHCYKSSSGIRSMKDGYDFWLISDQRHNWPN